MKAASCLALALACVGISEANAGRVKARTTPVQEVIELMEGMLSKGKKAKHEEEVQFARYKQFCADTTVEKKNAIAEAEKTIEVLTADIEKYTSDAAELAKQIAGHESEVSAWKGDVDAATKVRKEEKETYTKTHTDYSESCDALNRAVGVLKKQDFDRGQASLVQVSALKDMNLIPDDAKKAIDAFIQQDPSDALAMSAPEAAGYEFQSQGVVEMLEKLHDKFLAEKAALEREEKNKRHAYDMIVSELKSQITQGTQDKEEKTAIKAKKLEAKSDAEGDLADTTATRDADKTYLSDLVATCDEKASDFDSRQQLRAEELEAVQKAIDIIKSGAVQGNAEKHLPSFEQRGTALPGLRAERLSQAQARVAQFLRGRANVLGSRVLALLATRVAADPFRKVKKMIKDLLVRLMEEANEEAEHKAWCDTELATNEKTRNEKTESVLSLKAEIDELQADIAKLTEEIEDLTKAVAALDKAIKESTKIRQEEKAKNEETIADAKEGQAAVANALSVLKEFYKKAGEATALVQQQPEAPEIFEKKYTGMQDENGGVMGMLEVVESDFARLESDTAAAEEAAQKEYDTFLTDSQSDKISKSTDIEHKTSKKQDKEQKLTSTEEDLDETQKQLDAATAYFDKLKPSCVDSGVSFEDRAGRREQEIQSLQEALKILNGEDIA